MNVRMVSETKLKNAIVIFDEAHNIESAAEDGVSFDLTTSNLTDCESDIRILRDKARIMPDQCKISPANINILDEVVGNMSKNLSKWRSKISEEAKSDNSNPSGMEKNAKLFKIGGNNYPSRGDSKGVSLPGKEIFRIIRELTTGNHNSCV